MLNKNLKHIQQNKAGKFVIQKMINKKQTHCGVYDTLEEAVKVRDKLIESNWDLDLINTLKTPRKGKNRYITYNNGAYVICKRLDGKLRYFSRHHSLEEARCERDKLEEYGWDYSLLVECE